MDNKYYGDGDGGGGMSSLQVIVRDLRMVAKHSGVHQRYALIVFLPRAVGRVRFDIVVDIFVVKHFSCDFDVIVCCCKLFSISTRNA